jgi:hypothetical protein
MSKYWLDNKGVTWPASRCSLLNEGGSMSVFLGAQQFPFGSDHQNHFRLGHHRGLSSPRQVKAPAIQVRISGIRLFHQRFHHSTGAQFLPSSERRESQHGAMR